MSETTSRPDVLQDSFVVKIGRDEYVFRIPSIRFDLEVGYRATRIRAAVSPADGGSLASLDMTAVLFARHCAIMELYLTRSSATWPFNAGDDGKPTVNSANFPANRRDTIWKIGGGFDAEYARFCDDGPGDEQPSSP